jgi:anti-sigma B factor antagonist
MMTDVEMHIHERAIGDVSILDISGRMVLSERASDSLFRNTIDDLLSIGRRQLVVNLSRVSQVDTSGLTALVTAHLTASKSGGAIKLVSPTRRVRDLLGVTRLNTLFEVFDDEEKAVSSFSGREGT